MSTVVMVGRGDDLCMAADTLTTFGSRRKESARYVVHPEKIIRVRDSYVGCVGWSATQTVLQSALSVGCPLPEVRDEMELFEYSRKLHKTLKDDYYLNTSEDPDDPYESSQLTIFIMNRFGLFALTSLRSVDQYQCFAAIGSGSSYALGAMNAAYGQGLPVEDVARMGVEAGVEFDPYSLGPITLKKMKLER